MRLNSLCPSFIVSGKSDLSVGRRSIFCLLTLIFLLVTVDGCATGLGHDEDVSSVNEKIAAEVKLALVQEPKLNAAPIDITVNQGVVTLGGFVEEESQRQQAAQAARGVQGVESVINNIQIK